MQKYVDCLKRIPSLEQDAIIFEQRIVHEDHCLEDKLWKITDNNKV